MLKANCTVMSKLGIVAKSITSRSATLATCGSIASRSSARCEATVRPSAGSYREAMVPPVARRTTFGFAAMTQAAAVPARSSITCSSTLQPAARSSALAFSISLWLMPPSQGTKIMLVGHTRAM